MDRYEEALERANEAVKRGMVSQNFVDDIFGVESEDERIRKELKEAFEAYDIESKWNGIPIRSIFAWLEKQKEQKPYQEVLSDSENRMLDYHASLVRGEERKPFAHENDFVSKSKGYIENAAHNYAMNFGDKESELYIEIFDAYKAGAYYAELRQKPAEWSEEDLQHKSWILECLADGEKKMPEYAEDFQAAYKWLKSLRPQPHWKPSEEQMNELRNAVSRIATPNKVILDELYSDLEKLM